MRVYKNDLKKGIKISKKIKQQRLFSRGNKCISKCAVIAYYNSRATISLFVTQNFYFYFKPYKLA